jgi:hypothetical protein
VENKGGRDNMAEVGTGAGVNLPSAPEHPATGGSEMPSPDPTKSPRRPIRIQRQRTKGWRMPAGAVYVGRPTKFGNPWQVGVDWLDGQRVTHEIAARWYRMNVSADSAMGRDAVRELRGKDLACWCPLDQPCHADVLLKLANGGEQ